MGLLRLYLALCVIAAHSETLFPWQMHGGRQAVQIFYIISGFYIEFILSGKYSSKTSFYKSRALRIFPSYAIVALGVVALSVLTRLAFNDWLALSAYFSDPFSHNGVAGTLIAAVSNLTVFGQDWVIFLKHDAGQDLKVIHSMNDTASPLYHYLILPQSWSVAVELCFYLAAPFISRLKTPWLIMLVLASLALRLAAAKCLGLAENPWNYRFFPFELAHFGYGMLACRLYRRYKNLLPERFKIADLRSYIFFVAVALGVFWLQRQAGNWASDRIGTEYAMIMVMPSWIPLTMLLFALLEKNPVDRLIGELSYPVYLIHLTAIEFCLLLLDKFGLSRVSKGPLCAVLSVGAAYLLHQMCLRHIEEERQRRLARML